MAYKFQSQYNSPNFTPAASVPAVFGRARKVKYLTIHHWGSLGQSHSGVVNYLCRANGNTSAHYVVSAGLVTCIVDPDNAAWHAGNAVGNAESIGLELRPEATEADYQTAAELIYELRKVYGNVPLVPHKRWFNTACPGKWDLAKLDRMARAIGTAKPAATAAKPKPTTTKKETTVASASTKGRETWAYRNTKLDPRDAFRILRDIDAGVKRIVVLLERIAKKVGA